MQEDEFISCGNCGEETKISRVKFRLETLDAHTKCSGCDKNLLVKNWKCRCKKCWHECEQHCRAGEVFKRLNEKKQNLKKEDAELARDSKIMQKQLKIELNKMQSGVEISTNNHNAVITLQPKFDCTSNRTNSFNPNFLKMAPNLKRRLGM